jgi:hypothetical protein
MALQPLWTLGSFQSPDLFTIGTASLTSYQLVAKPLPKHRTAQTHNKHIYTPNIHVLSGIRTHDHGLRASENSLCLRLLGYLDRPNISFASGKLYFVEIIGISPYLVGSSST